MARNRGKRYREAIDEVDRTHAYPPAEAIALVKQTAGTKFDETVEVHMRLGVNVRHAEEQLRGTLALPHGLGKQVTRRRLRRGRRRPRGDRGRAPTTSAPPTSPSGSRRAGPTSTSRSRPRR